jgi:hypothetical protein
MMEWLVAAADNVFPKDPWDAFFEAYEDLFPQGTFWIVIFMVLVGAVWLKTRNVGMVLGMMLAMGGIFAMALPVPTRHFFLIFTGVGLGGLLYMAYVSRRR